MGFKGVYNAWTRGATIDVYSSKDISKKLGTVPMYKDDSGALTLTGPNGWVPSETSDSFSNRCGDSLKGARTGFWNMNG